MILDRSQRTHTHTHHTQYPPSALLRACSPTRSQLVACACAGVAVRFERVSAGVFERAIKSGGLFVRHVVRTQLLITIRSAHTRHGAPRHVLCSSPEVLSRVPDPVPLGAARFPPARRGSARPLRPLALTPVAGGRARALPLQEYVHAGQPRRHTTCVQMGETETQPKGFAATMHPGRRRRARFPARGGRVARARSLRRARGRASRAVCSRCTSLVDSSPRHSHDSALAWRAACAHCRHARAQAGLKRDRVSFCAFTHAASPPF